MFARPSSPMHIDIQIMGNDRLREHFKLFNVLLNNYNEVVLNSRYSTKKY